MPNAFKRLNTIKMLKDPQWKDYLYVLNHKNLNILLDSMQVREMGYPLRIAMLSQVIPENGGNTTPHGNGAYGIIGWRGDRAEGLPKDLPGQINRLMDDTYNDKRYKEWSHGGKGTGVQTGAEMLLLFRNSSNILLTTKAFMKGYVRPPASSMQKRLNLSELIKKYME